MATREQHTGYAEEYRRQAEANFDTSPATGRKLMWDAAVQSAQAAAHCDNSGDHPQSRNGIRNAAGRILASPAVQRETCDAADLAAGILPGGFYQPNEVDSGKCRKAFTSTQRLIDHLTQPDRMRNEYPPQPAPLQPAITTNKAASKLHCLHRTGSQTQ